MTYQNNELSDAIHTALVGALVDDGRPAGDLDLHTPDGLFGGGIVVDGTAGPVAVATSPTETTIIGPDGIPTTRFGADEAEVANLVADKL